MKLKIDISYCKHCNISKAERDCKIMATVSQFYEELFFLSFHLTCTSYFYLCQSNEIELLSVLEVIKIL